MKQFRRIFFGLLLAVLALVAVVALSIPIDRVLTRGRVATLTNLGIDGPDTTVQAYLASPNSSDDIMRPAIIMIHEFWGLKPELLGKADALADEGYVVIAPDTFRGRATNWLPTAIWQTIRTPTERVNQDLDAVYSWLAAQSNVDPDRLMVMGFCYGGGKALHYSLHNPDVAATAVFYGTPITDADALSTLPGAVLGIFGREDRSIPVSDVSAFEDALQAANIPNEVSLYDGVGHAFVKSIEDIRAGGQDALAWEQFLSFAADQLDLQTPVDAE